MASVDPSVYVWDRAWFFLIAGCSVAWVSRSIVRRTRAGDESQLVATALAFLLVGSWLLVPMRHWSRPRAVPAPGAPAGINYVSVQEVPGHDPVYLGEWSADAWPSLRWIDQARPTTWVHAYIGPVVGEYRVDWLWLGAIQGALLVIGGGLLTWTAHRNRQKVLEAEPATPA